MNYALLAAKAADSGTKMEIGDAAVTAVFGYVVVFFGLILLMAVLYVSGAVFKSKEAKANAAKAAAAPAKEAAPAVEAPAAPGSAGHVKLHGVPDKEAAMIMAIVADKMQTPLNELRFISIKEIK
ncbi:MAG: OadG family protein [Alistipes sp.]|nr:OadG family protein [Alistipes sp.]